jgi:hypothetical protein
LNKKNKKSKVFLVASSSLAYIMSISKKEEMKMISEKTVAKNIKTYGFQCGFVVKRVGVDLYTIYDTKMAYEVFRGPKYSAVQRVVDELHMIEYVKKNRSPVMGV